MTLNLTPHKCLQFRSSLEVFLAELGKDADIHFNGRVALHGWIHHSHLLDALVQEALDPATEALEAAE